MSTSSASTTPLTKEQQELLQQLQDIQLPDDIAWWPLAYGWWCLLALSLIILALLITRLVQRIQHNRYRRLAFNELQQHYANWQNTQHTAHYLQSANALLKRCFRHLNNEPGQLSVTGQTWIDALHNHAKRDLSEETQIALTTLCYQAQPQADIDAIHAQLSQWLKTHRSKPKLSAQAESQHVTEQRGNHA